jgi:2'-5' RNA ligase
MPDKTHQSAAAIVPAEEVWEPIQAIRRRHDRQVRRWMPHINLLYPFRPQEEFPVLAPAVVAACTSVKPFAITLAEFRFFWHGSGRCTLWLAPEPAEELCRLQAALQAAFPDCDDLARFPAGFTPHLSVGQFPSPRDCESTREQFQAGWQPIAFTVGAVALLARGEESPFGVEQRVPLGGPAPGS